MCVNVILIPGSDQNTDKSIIFQNYLHNSERVECEFLSPLRIEDLMWELIAQHLSIFYHNTEKRRYSMKYYVACVEILFFAQVLRNTLEINISHVTCRRVQNKEFFLEVKND